MKIRLLAPAQSELDKAFVWYEAEQKGLGQTFVREGQETLKRIVTFLKVAASLRPTYAAAS